MDALCKLHNIYVQWGYANSISPLPSADDLRFDYISEKRNKGHKTRLTSDQFGWLLRFGRIWDIAEDHESDKGRTDEENIRDLWDEYLIRDKRSFNEYFSEEHGIICEDSISFNQMKNLCEKLIGDKNNGNI